MTDRYVKTETTPLDRLTFAISQHISESVIEDLANPPQIRWLTDSITSSVRMVLRTDIFAQHLDRAVVKHPETWLDAVKQALYAWFGSDIYGHWPWFGDYARKRWPAKIRTIEIDVKALYPKIAAPTERHYITVLRHEKIA
jgi:hypothetical protein